MANTENKALTSEASTMRQKAIVIHNEKQTLSGRSFSEDDTMEHLYELEVHQIELELQIEALIQESSIAKDLSKKNKDAFEKYKDASEKYTSLYDFAPSGYFTLSKEGEIIDLNINGAKKLGKARPDLKNSLFGFFVSNDTKPIFNLFLSNIFNSKDKVTCKVTLSTNGNLPLAVYMTGIADENREQCLVNVVDIAEFKHEEQELIKAKEKAEEQYHFKSALLANMNNEIRTPMKGILGFTDLLKKPELSVEKQLICISMIENSGEHLLNIINDIMIISKVESGQMEISISETNINEQIENIYALFKPEIEGNGMQLLFHNSLPANEAIIQTDCEKINVIMTNLVKNALNFTHQGSINFGYTKKDKYLEFFVKDTGIWIQPDQLKIVFEIFNQASESIKSNYERAGLGLSIAKAYVGMLGGKIWGESEKGKGSTFYFTIPYNTEPIENNAIENVVSIERSEIQTNSHEILIAARQRIIDDTIESNSWKL